MCKSLRRTGIIRIGGSRQVQMRPAKYGIFALVRVFEPWRDTRIGCTAWRCLWIINCWSLPVPIKRVGSGMQLMESAPKRSRATQTMLSPWPFPWIIPVSPLLVGTPRARSGDDKKSPCAGNMQEYLGVHVNSYGWGMVIHWRRHHIFACPKSMVC